MCLRKRLQTLQQIDIDAVVSLPDETYELDLPPQDIAIRWLTFFALFLGEPRAMLSLRCVFAILFPMREALISLGDRDGG